MEFENLKKWALVAEIVGGIAVVLSLIFVGFEVRRNAEETNLNTQAIRTEAYQRLIGQISEVHRLIIENPELSEVRAKGLRNEPLDEGRETYVFQSWVRLTIRHADLAFVQFSNGLIDESKLLEMLAPLQFEVLSNTAGLAIWNSNSSLGNEFKNYVNSLPRLQ